MIEAEFRAIYRELIDENPLAIRAVLQILGIEFTGDVPTLAVTCTEKPILKVNLGFVQKECKTEEHVKALIVHEFLHILLRHTRSFKAFTPERHLATDAVINAIIHRQLGSAYSDLMSRYYAREKGIRKFLRPLNEQENDAWYLSEQGMAQTPLESAWVGLYEGNLCADDIEEIARDLRSKGENLEENLLGGHKVGHGIDEPSASDGPLSEALTRALDRSLETMNGDGIWRSPHGRGVAADAYQSEVLESSKRIDAWRRATFEVLKRHVDPSSNGALREDRPFDYVLPVLSSHDRRAALRSLWSPLLPEAHWKGQRSHRIGCTQIYLDVSGSMNAEMPLIVKLLNRLGRYIERPFWAFSNLVARAVIRNGRLVADTTGGTSMACVLEHVARTRPPAAVIVTDGYIERLSQELVRSASATRLHAIVTRDGSSNLLRAAQIPFTQLGRFPQ
jgi:hypothetical protein